MGQEIVPVADMLFHDRCWDKILRSRWEHYWELFRMRAEMTYGQ